MPFDKELFEKKLTILDKTIDKVIAKAAIPTYFTGNIAVIDFNTPRVVARVRQKYPRAKVYFIEDKVLKDLFCIPGLYYDTIGELISMLKNLQNDGLYIIANPPYNKIGAKITDEIRTEVDYIKYVNLLPAPDYKRNDSKDLFNYQTEMEPIIKGFTDAAVTTQLAVISKTKTNNLTFAEFSRTQAIDPSLDKYFAELAARPNFKTGELHRIKDIEKVIYVGMRDVNHHHLPYTKNCLSYKVNNNLITYKEAVEQYANHYDYTGDEDGNYFNGNVIVLSEQEKINFSEFIYSDEGFRFISKVFTARNVDGRCPLGTVMPKVDWTRKWTVSELLRDYGYSETEIREIRQSLATMKGLKK